MFEKAREIQRRKADENDETGFTLIELLIVIVVLGILAAVVVFALGSVTGQSAKAACSADAKTVETALAAYNANVGNYPTVVAATGITTTAQSATAGLTPYLRSWPSNTSHYFIGVQMVTGAPSGEVDVSATSGASAPAVGAASWVSYDSQGSATGCNAVS